MQIQRVYINVEFLAAFSAQKYELKCQSFVNSPSTYMVSKTDMLLLPEFKSTFFKSTFLKANFA